MAEETRKPIDNVRSILRSGQKIEVVRQLGDQELVYLSKLIRVDEKHFFVEPPLKNKEEIKLPTGEFVMVTAQGADALYELEAKLLQILETKSGHRQFQFVIPEKAWRTQRRSYFRVPLGEEAKVRIVKPDGQAYVPYGDWRKCYVVNISGGGIAFLTNEFIPTHGCAELEFRVFIKSQERIFQEVLKLVRVKMVKNRIGKDEYGYAAGGYFVSMKDRVRDEIIQFICQQQIAMQRKLRS